MRVPCLHDRVGPGLPAWSSALRLLVACIIATAAPVFAQDQAPGPALPPQPASSTRDPDFGVRARHFGLERQVEMYQWREDGGRYLRQWSRSPVDSSGFAPGHSNPPFPLQGKRWIARDVSVDGIALDPQVLLALGTWQEFRPGFTALPANLAATFQPEGNGLGSAENPLAPEIGDLRIHWLELLLPPLQGRIELRNGRWQLRAGTALDPAQSATATQVAADAGGKRIPWWIWVGGLVPVLVGVAAFRRRRRRR